jgi:hypothetical protein
LYTCLGVRLTAWSLRLDPPRGQPSGIMRAMSSTRLPRAVVTAIDASRIMGVRAGTRSDRRFTGVWPIVLDGRVFARSWSHKPGGWFRTLLEDPRGTVQVGERQVRVRAVRVRSERLLDAIERAYAEKYPAPGSRKYVRGFRTPGRRAATVEFCPR